MKKVQNLTFVRHFRYARYVRYAFVFLLVLCFLNISCSNSYEKVIDNYNKKYFKEVPDGERDYSIKNEDFDQSAMLSDSYELMPGMTFSLTAPSDASSYRWTALVPDAEDKKKENEVVIGNKTDLMYVVPGAFREDVVNKLVLTVLAPDGKEYKDTALIIFDKK